MDICISDYKKKLNHNCSKLCKFVNNIKYCYDKFF